MSAVGLRDEDVVFPGTMMDEPLLLKSIIERAEDHFGSQTVVWYAEDGPHEMTYADLIGRVRRLASALTALGVRVGDRVATIGHNDREHLELFMAVPAIGAVLHPMNFRVQESELDYVIKHAGDKVIVGDRAMLDRLPPLPSHIRCIGYGDSTTERTVTDYEALLASGDPDFCFPRIPEQSASAICFTGGTTGRPKGVVYTHRSTVLHTILESLPDYYGFEESDVVLPFIPLCHGNAWGLPYACLMTGARLVMPGQRTDPASMVEMLSEQRVTFSGGVPTIWHGVGELPALPDLSALRMVVVGGSALSETFLRRFDELGIPVIQGFGMTEANPLLAVGRVPARARLDQADRMRVRLAQGRLLPFVEARLAPESGGELQLRGPTLASSYYDAPEASAEKFTDDGWMRTGDIAEISSEGIVRIVDRTKDMIKSGGEWIPSIELENAILAHPAIVEAVIVAVPDERWGERPAAFVVVRDLKLLDADTLRSFLADRVPRWWIPEWVRISCEPIPRTGIGKLDKKAMRDLVVTIVDQGRQTETGDVHQDEE